MNKISFEIIAENGIHARPATKLVNLAMNFKAEIMLESDGNTINLKSIMGLMSLGIYRGEIIHLTADGEDEEEAVKVLSDFIIEENMGKSIDK
ncbi:MAG TPA: HPr family phosphocarrier protein [Acholeplasmataceae bacterium]|nr:HPr family phosphocarrier protein [Acholeplasmataceae bacterium]